MARSIRYAVFIVFVIVAVVGPPVSTQPSTADGSIQKDRTLRLATLKRGKNVATTPQRGFFGTIFNLIVEQINDTKSAYSQISDLVTNQFAEEETPKASSNTTVNGTVDNAKITRAEFLKILDRNLKGLARLRNLEWREAGKDSWMNLVNYKDEIFSGKKARTGR